jgi:hypothetical protein
LNWVEVVLERHFPNVFVRNLEFVVKLWSLSVLHAKLEFQSRNIVTTSPVLLVVLIFSQHHVKKLHLKLLVFTELELTSQNVRPMVHSQPDNAIHQPECAGVFVRTVLKLSWQEQALERLLNSVLVNKPRCAVNPWIWVALLAMLENLKKNTATFSLIPMAVLTSLKIIWHHATKQHTRQAEFQDLEPTFQNAKLMDLSHLYNATPQLECAGASMKMDLKLNWPEQALELPLQIALVNQKCVVKAWLHLAEHVVLEFQLHTIAWPILMPWNALMLKSLLAKSTLLKPAKLICLVSMFLNVTKMAHTPQLNVIHQLECAGVSMNKVLKLDLPEQVLEMLFLIV